jgi:probable F420-dependent oxidoreductase
MEVARLAEASGYHGMTVSDHVVYPKDLGDEYPQDYDVFPPESPWPDPFVTMAHLAAGTTTLRFLNTIYIATMREPIQSAKQIATAAILSGYRIDTAVAQGWMRTEFEILGAPFERRGARLDEILDVYRTLWSGGWVEHQGEFFAFPPLRMEPAPEGPMPLLGGGDAPRALARAAALDGWVGALYGVDRAVELAGELRAARGSLGLPEDDGYQLVCGFLEADRAVPTLDDCRRLEEAGYTGLYVAPWETHPPLNRDPGDAAVLDGIERFAAEVIDAGGWR